MITNGTLPITLQLLQDTLHRINGYIQRLQVVSNKKGEKCLLKSETYIFILVSERDRSKLQ